MTFFQFFSGVNVFVLEEMQEKVNIMAKFNEPFQLKILLARRLHLLGVTTAQQQ